MKLYQKVILLLFAIIFMAAITVCQDDKVPSNSYRVEIEDVFEMSDFSIKKLEITTKGTRRIHIQLPSGNEDMATINTGNREKYAKMTLLLVAEKISIDNRTFVFLRWLITTRGSKLSGLSTRIELLQSGKLSDEFELMFESGIFPIGQSMDFARIHDRTYKLLID